MADLDFLQSAGAVILMGSDANGAETYPAEIDSISSALVSTNKGVLTRSLLVGKTAGGAYLPVQVDTLGNFVVTSLTGFGAAFSFGDVTLASATKAFVRRTAYTEQASDATRSISSANAADTSAGTGARTLRITYYTSAGVGPLTTDVTLNGTTAVATSVSNICFIENIFVLTAGSGLTNAGIITLFVNNVGGGGTIGTINAGDKQTFWAHHYVPTGKICKVTGISCSHNGTTVGSGAVFTLEATSASLVNAIAVQVSDFVRLYGQSSTFSRAYQSPILVTGPAKLFLTCTPESTTSVVYRAAIDFFEP